MTKVLHHMDYNHYRASNHYLGSEKDKKRLIHSYYPFFAKDILRLKRVDKGVLEYTLKLLIGGSLLAGILLPIAKKFFIYSSPFYPVLVATFLSLGVFSLVGDVMRLLLAVDGESKNMHLFLNKGLTIWDIVKEKGLLYFWYTLIATISINILLAFVAPITISTFLLSCLVLLSFGTLTSLIQIGSTGLYPRLNWDNPYEVGHSSKAIKVEQILTSGLAVSFIFLITLSVCLEHFLIFNTATIICTVSIIILCSTGVSFLLAALYMNKVRVKEVFIRND